MSDKGTDEHTDRLSVTGPTSTDKELDFALWDMGVAKRPKIKAAHTHT